MLSQTQSRRQRSELSDLDTCGVAWVTLGSVAKRQFSLKLVRSEVRTLADPFQFVMKARYKQAKWLASQLISYRKPIVIMAVRYKKNTNLIDYSSSLQVAEILKNKNRKAFLYDPLVPQSAKPPPPKPSIFLIAQDAPFVHEFAYPPGSVVLDVWRCLKKEKINEFTESKPPITYVPVGRFPTTRAT